MNSLRTSHGRAQLAVIDLPNLFLLAAGVVAVLPLASLWRLARLLLVLGAALLSIWIVQFSGHAQLAL